MAKRKQINLNSPPKPPVGGWTATTANLKQTDQGFDREARWICRLLVGDREQIRLLRAYYNEVWC